MDRTSPSPVLEGRRPITMGLQTKVGSVDKKSILAVDPVTGGYGGVAAQEGEEKPSQTRREQGYGPGSGVGA